MAIQLSGTVRDARLDAIETAIGTSAIWWGYGLSPYIPELQAAYRGEIVAERALEPVNLLSGDAPPAGYHPPAKVFHF